MDFQLISDTTDSPSRPTSWLEFLLHPEALSDQLECFRQNKPVSPSPSLLLSAFLSPSAAAIPSAYLAACKVVLAAQLSATDVLNVVSGRSVSNLIKTAKSEGFKEPVWRELELRDSNADGVTIEKAAEESEKTDGKESADLWHLAGETRLNEGSRDQAITDFKHELGLRDSDKTKALVRVLEALKTQSVTSESTESSHDKMTNEQKKGTWRVIDTDSDYKSYPIQPPEKRLKTDLLEQVLIDVSKQDISDSSSGAILAMKSSNYFLRRIPKDIQPPLVSCALKGKGLAPLLVGGAPGPFLCRSGTRRELALGSGVVGGPSCGSGGDLVAEAIGEAGERSGAAALCGRVSGGVLSGSGAKKKKKQKSDQEQQDEEKKEEGLVEVQRSILIGRIWEKEEIESIIQEGSQV